MASRYRAIRRRLHDDSSNVGLYVAVGALAGIAAGVLLAQRYGGLSALSEKVSRGVRDRWSERFGERLAGDDDRREREAAGFRDRGIEAQDYDEEPLDDEYADEGEELEERVLEAFRNDPILSERAVDIGAIGRGIIELTGWVHEEDETHHAVTLTRGIPGVDTVVNRLVVREEEERLNDSARRYESGEAEPSARWEGQGVGIGRPRQGTSADPGRHADPKVTLEDRWQGRDKAIDEAADDIEGLAERRSRAEGSAAGTEAGTGEPSGRVTRAD